jgi:branched-chain amino acid transport system substrate-binding protein
MAPEIDRRAVLRGTAAAGALSALAGCTSAFGGNDSRRAIGLPTPQSGPLAPSGTAGLRGADVAAAEVAEDAAEVELVERDGQASPEEARSVVQEMIDDGVPVITGTFSSDVSNAVSDLVEREEVPFVTAISVDPAITGPDDEYTFRLTGNTTQKLTGVAQFFADQGIEGVGILGADYSMGRSAVEFMNDNAGDYGLTVEHEALVPLTTNNFVPEFENVNTDAIDAMFFPFPGGNGPTLIEQAREQGIFEAVDIVIGHDSYGTELYKQALGDGIADVYNWGVDLSNDRSQAASEAMREEFDVPMDALSLPNYDAIHTIAGAMEEAGSTAPGDVRDALAEMEYEAASGWPVRFDESGDNEAYQMLVNRWEETDDGLQNVVQYTSDVIPP